MNNTEFGLTEDHSKEVGSKMKIKHFNQAPY